MAGMGFLLGNLVPGREPEPSERFSALGLTSKILHQTNTPCPLCGGAVKSALATGILKGYRHPVHASSAPERRPAQRPRSHKREPTPRSHNEEPTPCSSTVPPSSTASSPPTATCSTTAPRHEPGFASVRSLRAPHLTSSDLYESGFVHCTHDLTIVFLTATTAFAPRDVAQQRKASRCPRSPASGTRCAQQERSCN